MDPHNHEENGWRSFNGEFRTNFMLPNFIGFGNGITRGFGSIFSLNHPNNLEFQNSSKELASTPSKILMRMILPYPSLQ